MVSELVNNRDWYVNSVGITMLRIPQGTFVRTDSEDPSADAQSVTITRPFLLADREVTEPQFRQFVDDPDYPDAKKPIRDRPGATAIPYALTQRPANFINWYEAILFCNWLSETEELEPAYEQTGEKRKVKDAEYDVWRLDREANGYRLPTEAEWEYACRAGTTTAFVHRDDETLLDRYAVFDSPRWQSTGSKMPNGWGLFDVHGNVWEWCQDSSQPYGSQASVTDPLSVMGPDAPRVVRGGAFFDGPRNANSSFRGAKLPEHGLDGYGFRIARNHP
jgi:formylglycine-generating enzyme required for sulfatase activity